MKDFLPFLFLCFSLVSSQCIPGSTAANGYLSGATAYSATTLPRTGAVTIPAGQKIKLDVDLNIAGLTVLGELLFDLVNVNITTPFIYVNGGTFSIGSSACRYNNKAIITLTGAAGVDPHLQPGYKYFKTDNGGKLYLYGHHDVNNYVRLSKTLKAGDTVIEPLETASWKLGDKIVVASTDYNSDQTEVFTISSVLGANKFQISPAAVYAHWGELDPLIDERAEVATINRPIVIQGDQQSDTYSPKFGGHFVVNNQFTYAHIEGVEFLRMGQSGILGKYPIHFHLCGDVSAKAKVLHNVVHSSYQRCVVIHGTNGLPIQNNVCYGSTGHAIFLEDGIEVSNVIEGNLIVDVNSGTLLPSDPNPTGIWITNPNNYIRNNVVAGSRNHCFWFALPEHPMGPSQLGNEGVFNRHIPLLEFRGNKAHSCGGDGLHVDSGPLPNGVIDTGTYSPRSNSLPNGTLIPAYFDNFIAYKCRNRGVWFRGGSLELRNPIFADNAIGCTFAHGGGADQRLNGGVIIGNTMNIGSPQAWESKGSDGRSLPKYSPWPIRGVEFYDGPVTFANTRFFSFNDEWSGAVSVLRQDQFSIFPTNNLRNITFHPSVRNRVYYPEIWNDGDKNQVFRDMNGSCLGNNQKAWIVQNLPFYTTPSCTIRSDWKAAVCPMPAHAYGRLVVQNLRADSMTYTRNADNRALIGLTVTRDEPGTAYPQQLLWGDGPDDDIRGSWGVSLLAGRRYILNFNFATPSEIRLNWGFASAGDYVVIGIRYPAGTQFDCDLTTSYSASPGPRCWLQRNWYPDNRANKATSLAEVEAGTGTNWYHDPATGLLWMKLLHTAIRADSDLGSSNSFVMYIKPLMGAQVLSTCPVLLATDFQTYSNNEKCIGSQSVDDQCPGWPYCAGHGSCASGSSSCNCDPGWKGTNCADGDCNVLYPTCSGRGTCSSTTGLCTCQSGSWGPDCSRSNICPNSCSGRGSCVKGACVCNAGYSGSDCGSRLLVEPSAGGWKYLIPDGTRVTSGCCPPYPYTITYPTALTFTQNSFSDATWATGVTPFYNVSVGKASPIPLSSTCPCKGTGTPIPRKCVYWNCDANFYFRKSFSLTSVELSAIQTLVLKVAANNGADIYLNGVQIDNDGLSDHPLVYWNRIVSVPVSRLVAGTNVIAVYLYNEDWSNDAYLDLEFSSRNDNPCSTVSCTGLNEYCFLGQCVCNNGYVRNSLGVCNLMPGAVCAPDCAGKTCGPDGCGGNCGTCGTSDTCISGSCVCSPQCSGKQCGTNGCGGSCGTCSGANTCTIGGLCACTPSCAGKLCGNDGCGGSCGTCGGGSFCQSLTSTCVASCTPSCTGKVCGDNGCGGSCGTCTGNNFCNLGACECSPNCVGKQCGNNGCGGVCGSCDASHTCNITSFQCDLVCTPQCNRKQCGDDTCGGSCGSCASGEECYNGICGVPNLCIGAPPCSDPNSQCDPGTGTCQCNVDFVSIGGQPCTPRNQEKCLNVVCGDPLKNCDSTSGECVCIHGFADASQTTCLGCTPGDIEPCNVAYGQGLKTCNSAGTYSACGATSCDPNYVVDPLTKGCRALLCTVGQVELCSVVGGDGERRCPNGTFTGCSAQSCDAGFLLQSNACLPLGGEPSDALLVAESSEGFLTDEVIMIGGATIGAVVVLAAVIAVVVIVIKKKKKAAGGGWF